MFSLGLFMKIKMRISLLLVLVLVNQQIRPVFFERVLPFGIGLVSGLVPPLLVSILGFKYLAKKFIGDVPKSPFESEKAFKKRLEYAQHQRNAFGLGTAVGLTTAACFVTKALLSKNSTK